MASHEQVPGPGRFPIDNNRQSEAVAEAAAAAGQSAASPAAAGKGIGEGDDATTSHSAAPAHVTAPSAHTQALPGPSRPPPPSWLAQVINREPSPASVPEQVVPVEEEAAAAAQFLQRETSPTAVPPGWTATTQVQGVDRESSPAATPAWMAEAPPIEPAGSEEVSEDEFIANDVDSDLVSVTSSVYAHTYERGRRYQSFKNSRYPIPNDDQEQTREDMKHVMLMEITNGELFFSPTGKNPQKIVDIGTGTGIWAIEVGDSYPSASVLGIDLTPIQPLWVPPNVEFIVDDCEKDWLLENVDLAHFRFMAMILKNVPLVMEHAYAALRPGGWIEFQELLGMPFSDDKTMKDDDPFKVLYELAGQAYAKLGLSTSLPAELEPMLLAAGFENIHCRVIKIPIGTWAKDKTMRLVGLYQKTAVTDFISTLAVRPFQALGMSEQEAQVRLALARQALDEPHVHRYFNYYFWYAQKPGAADDAADDGDDFD